MAPASINPVRTVNPEGRGRVVFICEHASSFIPEEFGSLGLREEDRTSHAVWDPGAQELSECLSTALDAPLILGTISRLVYDCNRPPSAKSAYPDQSELIKVPGNRGLSQNTKDARAALVYRPFCDAVSKVLDQPGPDRIVVTVHSFTKTYFGKDRQVELGLLSDTDTQLADAMMSHAEKLTHRVVERNQPYGPEDGVTHSLQIHAISRKLPNVMIEARNDLLRSPDAVKAMADDILSMLLPAIEKFEIKEQTG